MPTIFSFTLMEFSVFCTFVCAVEPEDSQLAVQLKELWYNSPDSRTFTLEPIMQEQQGAGVLLSGDLLAHVLGLLDAQLRVHRDENGEAWEDDLLDEIHSLQEKLRVSGRPGTLYRLA